MYVMPTMAPSQSPDPQSIPEAMLLLARWYFESYGPTTLDDFVWWSGCPAAHCRAAVGALKEDLLEEVEVEQMENETLFMAKHHVEILRACEDGPPHMARFLPYEDALIKAYKKTRYRFYDKAFEKQLFTKGGEARPSVWLNGTMIGVWKWTNKPGKEITISLCKKITKNMKKLLSEEISLVGGFVDASEVIWEAESEL